MKLSNIYTLLLIFLSWGLSAQDYIDSSKAYPEAEKEVKATIEEIERTIRENDTDQLISLHAYGPKFTEFDLGGKRQGSKENEAFERNFLGAITEVQKWEYNDLKIHIYGGNVANTTFHADLKFKIGKEQFEFTMQGTLLFIKTKDGWKITHEHMAPLQQSPPKPKSPMDTNIPNKDFPKAQEEITRTIEDIAQSVKDGDIEKLISFHDYGPHFTEFKNGEKRVGSKDNEMFERNTFSAVTDVLKFDFNDLKIVPLSNKIANVTFHSDFHLKFGEDLAVVNDQITLIFVKNDKGDWKIVHEHHSPLKTE